MSTATERCAVCGFSPETRDRATIWRDVARAMIEAPYPPRFYGLRSALEYVQVHPHMRQSFSDEWNTRDLLQKLDASHEVRGLYACLLASISEIDAS